MVFVTGGSGLLGSHVLLELLRSGRQVRALKRRESNLIQVSETFRHYGSYTETLFSKIEWVDGALEDIYSLLDAMDGVDEVYHCAGLVSFNPKDVTDLFLANTEGTANIVSAALEKKVKKLCHVSSIAALGLDGDLITEETFWKSSAENSTYAISKYAAEREIWRGMEEGLNAVIVNPSVILGPGNWNTGSTALFRKSYAGLKFYTEGTTGFVDVRDVAAIMTLLMKKDIFGERFIVSSENRSFREFFDIANTCFHQPRPYLKAGKGLSELAWRLEKIKNFLKGNQPLITKETARASQMKKYYSNSKVKTTLDYNFISVEKSIQETCSLFLSLLLT